MEQNTTTPRQALKDWVPALAQEVYGKKWSPNCDFIIHLQAQAEARGLGIQWRNEMDAADVAKLADAVRTIHAPKGK